MRAITLICTVLSCAAGIPAAPQSPAPSSPDDQYLPGPDSKPQPGVPKGKTFEFTLDRSKIFPGTTRKIIVYIPAEYSPDRPACVYVGLDGLAFNAPVVFDNLINRHEMPVTIGIGIAPGTELPPLVSGVEGAAPEDPRFNRSFEFDALNDNLARFVLEEVLPEVERHKTPDGLPIRLSRDPNDRAAGGASTGGIGAFTLAWERPDAFRRVFTAIGTFVGMRGGDRYPVLVRKTEPKPIRIFMQDGANDELTTYLGEIGDWWMSNQTMERALEFAGYDVEHVWGEGTHNGAQGTAVFPDAMRFLWKGWPDPIVARESHDVLLQAILVPGESWQIVPANDSTAPRMADHSRGFHVLSQAGRTYQTETATGNVWLSESGKRRILLDSGLKAPTGIALSPDGFWLAVAESKTHFGYSYRIASDGTLRHKEPFYWFHVPVDADESGAGALAMDREGRLYAATRMGVQVFDHNGRSRAILPLPAGAVDLSFGGSDLATLYVSTTDHKVYRRRLKVPGFAPGGAHIEVPNWGAG
jgi:gluconolactonase